jgi:hypothetical protein
MEGALILIERKKKYDKSKKTNRGVQKWKIYYYEWLLYLY